MGTIMLSYSRHDQDVVKTLARGFEAARREVWFDHDLGGGDAWWDSILASIRSSSVFLFALSDASLHSKPCRLELEYALDLGRPVLPVQVGQVTSLRTTPVSELQIICYDPNDARSGFAVLAAVEEADQRVRPLPDPLPAPPPIPFAYLLAIGRRIESGALSVDDQVAVLDQLRRALGEESDESVRRDILAMLDSMQSKTWTTRASEREIRALLYAHSSPLPVDDEPTVRTNPAVPVESSVPVETSVPVGPAAQDRPGEPSRPVEPDEATVPGGPSGPSGPTGSTGPARPADPAGEPVRHPDQPDEFDTREWFAERIEQIVKQREDAERSGLQEQPSPPPAAGWRPAGEQPGWAPAAGQPGWRPGAEQPGGAPADQPGWRPAGEQPGWAPAGEQPAWRPAAEQPGFAWPRAEQSQSQPASQGQPAPQPVSTAAPEGPETGHRAAPAGAPADHRALSVLALLLGLVFGAVALTYSSRVRQRAGIGDLAGARQASARARSWAITGIVLGVAGWVVVLALAAAPS